jgi:DNA-binding NarL/FixJ family response regulator
MPSTTRNILIVDSDAAVRASLIESLDELPLAISEAADGATAMHMLSTGSFRLVITDLYVHAGNSKCLVHAINDTDQHTSTRVLVYTGHTERADHAWAKAGGANGFFVRPVLRERLRNAVRRLTSRGTTFREATLSDRRAVVIPNRRSRA